MKIIKERKPYLAVQNKKSMSSKLGVLSKKRDSDQCWDENVTTLNLWCYILGFLTTGAVKPKVKKWSVTLKSWCVKMGWVDWAPIPAGMFGSSPLKGYWLEVKGTPQQQQQRQRQRQRQWQRPERRSWRWGNGLYSLSNGHDRRLLVLLLLSNVDHVGDYRSLGLKS